MDVVWGDGGIMTTELKVDKTEKVKKEVSVEEKFMNEILEM